MGNGKQGRVLIVAGSDSGGGAGIQADIKSVTAMGGFAMTAVTAITVQNTLGVSAIHEVPLDIVVGQMRAVLEDLGADAVKTGMLHNAEIVEAVAEELSREESAPLLVADPVMIAKGGASLLEDSAVSALKEVLIPLSALVTPNVPEAEVLTGRKIVDVEGQKGAADALLGLGAEAVLVKGGHLSGDLIFDVLATQETIQVFSSPRIDTRHTHGTGCTLASAIAALLAQGIELTAAVAAARDYVHEAIRTAPGFGKGHGPLNFLAVVDDGEI
ncbi:bifunctional hydroxymethylpyrimidine kinase/phosphomethylpyrimidine kinase [Parvibaculum sp.]|uniref:bifunctional hydroxymethylpyrimidine kinase/phosphomethylpyrimidine kinase n=1 Tax=Parvibaculum sp. TaxID=2024848 RepID=UPI001B264E93|nr:bifunctional hydroxymethylpyrimidine kinase/phosphomethylpyrimidine kinase [Parvibaculum sp.]MBO6634562.1 bifunctional hydroxymethylpyrimidine kinase/phosphomethylpyrimidine kinase [Parvibaculum sp.]MBO6679510.1 bifunctional hydroxymethylpyrimidine kinase/phosphomethylpyrimidine kinase [Parvibaculum sp.]MBO6684907.1 bifunctional hydroxymethylpyrimidine kinase/phosphomethylpyrimidine kinase [Parvibaculum sp.]MBO6904272.1 bifunctional hydroxymethylpyrimidine kinase/phosphomethylpyrimidine kina